MNDIQREETQKKLAEIETEMQKHNLLMTKLRAELLACVKYFDSYAEMYAFVKQSTKTLAQFNIDMWDARTIWDLWDSADKKEVK